MQIESPNKNSSIYPKRFSSPLYWPIYYIRLIYVLSYFPGLSNFLLYLLLRQTHSAGASINFTVVPPKIASCMSLLHTFSLMPEASLVTIKYETLQRPLSVYTYTSKMNQQASSWTNGRQADCGVNYGVQVAINTFSPSWVETILKSSYLYGLQEKRLTEINQSVALDPMQWPAK